MDIKTVHQPSQKKRLVVIVLVFSMLVILGWITFLGWGVEKLISLW